MFIGHWVRPRNDRTLYPVDNNKMTVTMLVNLNTTVMSRLWLTAKLIEVDKPQFKDTNMSQELKLFLPSHWKTISSAVLSKWARGLPGLRYWSRIWELGISLWSFCATPMWDSENSKNIYSYWTWFAKSIRPNKTMCVLPVARPTLFF